MSRTTLSLSLLLVLTTAGSLASASPKPPDREQMSYARREVELESQLAKTKLKYTESHPYVVKLQQEIDSCKQRTTPLALSRVRRGKQPRIATLEQELALKETNLQDMKLRYTDGHPLVKAAQQDVDTLVGEIALRKKR